MRASEGECEKWIEPGGLGRLANGHLGLVLRHSNSIFLVDASSFAMRNFRSVRHARPPVWRRCCCSTFPACLQLDHGRQIGPSLYAGVRLRRYGFFGAFSRRDHWPLHAASTRTLPVPRCMRLKPRPCAVTKSPPCSAIYSSRPLEPMFMIKRSCRSRCRRRALRPTVAQPSPLLGWLMRFRRSFR